MDADTGTEWVTVRDAARIARVHTNTVRNWVREGRVRQELIDGKHGPTYRIALEDLPRAAASPAEALLMRLGRAEDARLEEVRGRATAETRLEAAERELAGLRAEIEQARGR